MSKGVFVTGIGTGVGKTIVSALLCKAFGTEYWKPIQCGSLEDSDSMAVENMSGAKVYPERYRLKTPASPHYAAWYEEVEIDLAEFSLPRFDKGLVVEGAGGLLVPLNTKGETMRDLVRLLDLPVVVVSSYYLGSINHTLMTLEAVRAGGLEVAAVIMNGKRMEGTREVIERAARNAVMLDIPSLEGASKKSVEVLCEKIRESDLKKFFS